MSVMHLLIAVDRGVTYFRSHSLLRLVSRKGPGSYNHFTTALVLAFVILLPLTFFWGIPKSGYPECFFYVGLR